MADTEHRITIIRELPERIESLIHGLSPADLTTVYTPGEWTIAQVIHHLLDAHCNSYLLFKLILTEDNPGLRWSRQEKFAELPDACTSHVELSLGALHGLHTRWAYMLEHIEDWTRHGTSMKSGKVYNLDDLLTMYADHCTNHIGQIQSLLAARQEFGH